MVEEQVDVEVIAVDHDPLLAGDEREPAPEFEDERLHLAQDGRLDILLAVGVLQPQEVEKVRVAEHEVGREFVRRAEFGEFLGRELLRLPRQRRPLEEDAVDLRPQGADAPPLDAAHVRVEVTLQLCFERQKFDEVGPTQLSRQRRDNFL